MCLLSRRYTTSFFLFPFLFKCPWTLPPYQLYTSANPNHNEPSNTNSISLEASVQYFKWTDEFHRQHTSVSQTWISFHFLCPCFASVGCILFDLGIVTRQKCRHWSLTQIPFGQILSNPHLHCQAHISWHSLQIKLWEETTTDKKKYKIAHGYHLKAKDWALFRMDFGI